MNDSALKELKAQYEQIDVTRATREAVQRDYRPRTGLRIPAAAGVVIAALAVAGIATAAFAFSNGHAHHRSAAAVDPAGVDFVTTGQHAGITGQVEQYDRSSNVDPTGSCFTYWNLTGLQRVHGPDVICYDRADDATERATLYELTPSGDYARTTTVQIELSQYPTVDGRYQLDLLNAARAFD